MDTVSTRYVRWGALCGLAMIAGILLFEVIGPSLAGAGEEPGAFASEAEVRTYYGHAALGPLQMAAPLVAVLGLFFIQAVGQRTQRPGSPWSTLVTRTFSVFIAGILVTSGITIALVRQATTGGDVMTLFRLLDSFFNVTLEILQGFLIVFVSLAALGTLPRWFAYAGIPLAIYHPIMAVRAFTPLPEAVHLIGVIAFVAWLATLSILTFRAPRAAPSQAAKTSRTTPQ